MLSHQDEFPRPSGAEFIRIERKETKGREWEGRIKLSANKTEMNSTIKYALLLFFSFFFET